MIALDRALEYEGSNARIHACKGYALYRLNRFKEAAESFAKALKRQPKDVFSLLYRGKSLLHNEQWETGIAAFDKLLAIDGKNAPAWDYKGLAYSTLRCIMTRRIHSNRHLQLTKIVRQHGIRKGWYFSNRNDLKNRFRPLIAHWK